MGEQLLARVGPDESLEVSGGGLAYQVRAEGGRDADCDPLLPWWRAHDGSDEGVAEGASAADNPSASDVAALLPRCEDEIRRSRLHFRPFPAHTSPGRPTNAHDGGDEGAADGHGGGGRPIELGRRRAAPTPSSTPKARVVASYFNGRRERKEKWEGVNAKCFNSDYY
jgi:hypothetical protein